MKPVLVRHTWALALGIATLGSIGCGGKTLPATRTPPTETTSTRATDANKGLVRTYLDEVWGQKNPEAAAKYFAADLVNHAAIASAQGAAGMQSIVRKVQKAFPDVTITIESMAADEDLVIARLVLDGTQKEPLEFAQPIPATNRHVHLDQVFTFRVKEGRIVEVWMVMDRLEMAKQLGQLPGPDCRPPS
jgi:predicted ester cyclase